MTKTRIFLFVVFASFIAGLIFSSKSYASAPEGIFTRPIPVCENFPDFLPVLKDEILKENFNDKTIYVGFVEYTPWVSSTAKKEYYSYFNPASGSSNNPFYVLDDGSKYSFIYGYGSSLYEIPKKSVKSLGTYSTANSFCLSASKGVRYAYLDKTTNIHIFIDAKDYKNYKAINDFTKTTPKYEGRCSVMDAFCWISKGISNIGESITEMFNGIVKLFENILEFFGNLFVPNDENIFVNTFTDLNENMRKKLGFLTFPFDFLGKLYQSISYSADNMNEGHCFWGRKGPYSDPTNWSGVPTCPEICAKKILGDADICINFGELERRIPEVWAVGINILRFGVLLSLIEILRRKYLSVVRG